MSDAFDLAPGEVAADRYDPADEQLTPSAAPAAVADPYGWDATPWF